MIAAAEVAGGVALAALAGRKELALLAEPSAARVAAVLGVRCRNPAPWIRAAAGTLGRFAAEVAGGDLAGLLGRGRADPAVAERSLTELARRHPGCTASQLSALQFGPKLWWRLGGVAVPWRPPAATVPDVLPMPGAAAAGSAGERDLRLLMLALLGTGLTVDELFGVRVRDAGALDVAGAVVPDLDAEPLALSYLPAGGDRALLTFLPFEARAALHARLRGRRPDGGERLLLPDVARPAAREAVAARSAALIGAGNDVNVTLCRATGDFFRTWGMPGARFDARQRELT